MASSETDQSEKQKSVSNLATFFERAAIESAKSKPSRESDVHTDTTAKSTEDVVFATFEKKVGDTLDFKFYFGKNNRGTTGLFIRSVTSQSSLEGLLKPDDQLVKINDQDIRNSESGAVISILENLSGTVKVEVIRINKLQRQNSTRTKRPVPRPRKNLISRRESNDNSQSPEENISAKILHNIKQRQKQSTGLNAETRKLENYITPKTYEIQKKAPPAQKEYKNAKIQQPAESEIQRILREKNDIKNNTQARFLEKKNEMQRLQQQNSSIVNENETLKKENIDKDNQIENLWQEIENQNIEIQQLQQKNSRIEHEKDNKDNEIRNLQQENYRKTNEIQQLHRQKDNEIKNITEHFQAKDNEIRQENQQLHREIQEKNIVIQRQEQDVERKDNEIQYLQQVIENNTGFAERGSVVVSMEELGRGAYGTVCKGDFYGTKVAVKEYYQVILSNYNRSRFAREINIASQCRHPNLLQFICASENDQHHLLIVTELLDMTLRTLIEQHAQTQSLLSSQGVQWISLDVARGLNYLHSKKPHPIIHRDISSANVLLSIANGVVARAKISDYGSAKFMEFCNTKNPGAAIYAAPEAGSSQQDPKLDVFSYGILVCEMAICVMPDQMNRRDQINQILHIGIKHLVYNCTRDMSEERPNMHNVITTWENMKME